MEVNCGFMIQEQWKKMLELSTVQARENERSD